MLKTSQTELYKLKKLNSSVQYMNQPENLNPI